MRSGESTNLRALELKALVCGLQSRWRFFVPPGNRDHELAKSSLTISPIRAIVRPAHHQRQHLQKADDDSGAGSDGQGRQMRALRPVTPTLDELSFPAMELSPCRRRRQALLEDAAINIDEWLASEVEQVFAAQEGAAFITGDGNNKPKGFLAYSDCAPTDHGPGAILATLLPAFPALFQQQTVRCPS